MSATVKTTIYKEPFSTQYNKYKEQFLVGTGILVSNQAADNWNVRTGRGRNSVMYITSDGKTSGFGNISGDPGAGAALPLTSFNKISKPGTPNTVKIGSGLVYALAHEKKVAWLSKGIDRTIAGIKSLAIRLGRIFK